MGNNLTPVDQMNIVAGIITGCCSLSILGAIYIITKYIIHHHCQKKEGKQMLKFINTNILWIAITDVIDYSSELFGSIALLSGYWEGGMTIKYIRTYKFVYIYSDSKFLQKIIGSVKYKALGLILVLYHQLHIQPHHLLFC